MRQRIGTKLYDTEKANCIIPEIGLYKQGKSQSYFMYDGLTITPIEFSAAQKLLEEKGLLNITKHSIDYKGRAKIGISPEAADHLASYCRSHGVTQKKVIEDFIATLDNRKGSGVNTTARKKKLKRLRYYYDFK